MPRKKAPRTTQKKTAAYDKRPLKKTAPTLAEVLEKDFIALPAKLPAVFRKDIEQLKKQEQKLSSSLKKLQAKKIVVKTKEMAISAKLKENPSSSLKKQMTAIRKYHDQINTQINRLTDQLTQSKKTSHGLVQKEAKYIALSKEIRKLDKAWESKLAQKLNSISKTRTKKAKKIKEVISKEMDSGLTTDEIITHPGFESDDTNLSNHTEEVK